MGIFQSAPRVNEGNIDEEIQRINSLKEQNPDILEHIRRNYKDNQQRRQELKRKMLVIGVTREASIADINQRVTAQHRQLFENDEMFSQLRGERKELFFNEMINEIVAIQKDDYHLFPRSIQQQILDGLKRFLTVVIPNLLRSFEFANAVILVGLGITTWGALFGASFSLVSKGNLVIAGVCLVVVGGYLMYKYMENQQQRPVITF